MAEKDAFPISDGVSNYDDAGEMNCVESKAALDMDALQAMLDEPVIPKSSIYDIVCAYTKEDTKYVEAEDGFDNTGVDKENDNAQEDLQAVTIRRLEGYETKQEAESVPQTKTKESKLIKTPLSVAWKVFTTISITALVFLAIALVGVRIFGFTPYSILSPSMTPEYSPGDLVYVKDTDVNNIKVGDVLTFVANDDLTVVTHRVDEISREKRCFYTKGDANSERDNSPVLYENVVGTVRFSLPKLGYVSNYFSSETGRYIGVVAAAILVLMLIIPELLKPERKEDKIEQNVG